MKSWIRWAPVVVLALMAWVLADATWAQDLVPIQNVTRRLHSAMTGNAALFLAACAIAIAGYLYWSGQIDYRIALAIVVGIGLVFGSLPIATAFKNAVGTQTAVLGG